MREKWREMSLFQRVLLAILAAMILGFGIATPVMGAREGLEYGDTLLYFTQEGEVRRYAGRVDGRRAEFTVTPERTVEYRWGEYTYGPYRIVDDPTASPRTEKYLPGIEIRREDEVLFRGGYTESPMFPLIREDGSWTGEMIDITYSTSDGTVYDSEGNELTQQDLHQPGLTAIFNVAMRSELTTRGNFLLYLAVTLLTVFNIFQICFPGFMFRMGLWGYVRDPEAAEPSDFYIFMERAEWVFLTGMAAVLYWMAITTIN